MSEFTDTLAAIVAGGIMSSIPAFLFGRRKARKLDADTEKTDAETTKTLVDAGSATVMTLLAAIGGLKNEVERLCLRVDDLEEDKEHLARRVAELEGDKVRMQGEIDELQARDAKHRKILLDNRIDPDTGRHTGAL